MLHKVLSIIANWRNWVLILMGVTVFILLICESESLTAVIISKIADVVLYILTAALFIHWKEKGKFNEMSDTLDR